MSQEGTTWSSLVTICFTQCMLSFNRSLLFYLVSVADISISLLEMSFVVSATQTFTDYWIAIYTPLYFSAPLQLGMVMWLLWLIEYEGNNKCHFQDETFNSWCSTLLFSFSYRSNMLIWQPNKFKAAWIKKPLQKGNITRDLIFLLTSEFV